MPYLAVSAAELHYKCVHTINCTARNTSLPGLINALDNADGNKFVCSNNSRPGESSFAYTNVLRLKVKR